MWRIYVETMAPLVRTDPRVEGRGNFGTDASPPIAPVFSRIRLRPTGSPRAP